MILILSELKPHLFSKLEPIPVPAIWVPLIWYCTTGSWDKMSMGRLCPLKII